MVMKNTNQIHSIGTWLKGHFGEKVVKLSLDGGFTCPNRDGTKGTGGCIFVLQEAPGTCQHHPQQMELLREKWPGVSKYIAYFSKPYFHLRTGTGTGAKVQVL